MQSHSTLLFFVAGSTLLWFSACAPPETKPCAQTSDCSSGQSCLQGQCTHTQKETSPESRTSENQQTDASPAENQRTDRSPSCAQTPPDCGSRGVCIGLKPVCKQGKWSCEHPPSYEPTETRCDNKDNDCDGQIDEELQQPCYSGPPGTAGVADCKQGRQTCTAGQWGMCTGEMTPRPEICDGKDNNCDGQIDEDFKGKGDVCSVGVGACKETGTLVCSDDQKALRCTASARPALPEVCDGKDNDCDGKVDEEITQECYTAAPGTKGVGLCRSGKQVCISGQWGACTGEIKPTMEVCDNKDNDCDGLIDNAIQRPCYTGPTGTKGVGLCKGGIQTCTSGQWGTCAGEVKPVSEVCDNRDNDCDGKTDEDLRRACYTGPAGTKGVGLCKEGSQFCKAGQWGACAGEVKPVSEICNNKDEDCDGQVDDGSSICGSVSRTCVKGSCVCNNAKGYYAFGLQCLKDGDSCPTSLVGKQVCLDGNHLALCDPFGRVGVLTCSAFTGGACKRVALGTEGCTMPSASYQKRSCIKLTTGYSPTRSWEAVMQVVGPQANAAVALFHHCTGGGKSSCGTIVTGGGYVTACLCGGERKLQCTLGGRSLTLYDPSYYDATTRTCRYFFGNRFGCPDVFSNKNGCSKSYVNGFSSYGC